ncbi:penicillin-binding protein 1C [bacterium]|nr:penicillin-binding protein 1C [bacterium]MBU1884315.1 penicillin-binding protein 1C [bacterium]
MKKLFLALFILLLGGFFAYKWYQVPDKTILAWHTYSTLYKDANNNPLRLTLADDEKYRLWVPYDAISKHVVDATIMYEDKYFYSHPGVNFPSLWRAFVSTYITYDRRVGASTITMQVAKVAFNLKSREISGKLQQIFYALWLEQHYTKQQILEFYFNSVSYGGNIEGIEAASQIYFHKSVSELNIPQALSLVVIPQNPTKRNPLNEEGYKNMITARDHLNALYQETLSPKDKEDNKAWINLPLHVYTREEFPFLAPHFVNYLERDKFNSGIIHTTLDINKQNILEKEIKNWLNKSRTKGFTNACALLIDKKSMEVKAWVGSADFYNEKILGQVDGITAKRSPGSTLKPFVYALGMDQSLIHPNTLLKDTPYRLQAYTPENYDRVFLGPISATKALIYSRNVPAVRLASQLTTPSFYTFLKDAGVSDMKDPSFYGMSIALGGMEVTPLEIGKLYGAIANGGELEDVHLIKDDQNRTQTKVLSAESAYLTLDMLRKNPSVGTKSIVGVHKKEEKYAWKTGTSFAFRDALSVGIGNKYILLVWIGNFDGTPNPNFVGREAAGPLFFNIMRALDEKDVFANDTSPALLNISKVDICESTGALPSKLCPKVKKGWFIPGVSPITVSNVYREIPINIKTGLRACKEVKGKTKMEVFEFWPSDIQEIFLMAGVKKKSPPPYESGCTKNTQISSEPTIQSPTEGLIYTLEPDKIKESRIPFTAILDADSHKAFWYVDKAFVGNSESNKPLFWKPKLGEFSVTVIDEKGLSASRKIKVELAQ